MQFKFLIMANSTPLELKLNRELSKLNYRIHMDAIMESYNAILIQQGKSQAERMKLLHELAVQQMTTMSTLDLKKLPGIEVK